MLSSLMSPCSSFSLLTTIVLLFSGQGASSYEHHITTADGIVDLSKNVNSGTSYNGTTVLLGADIDFSSVLSEQFESIGIYGKPFQGTFDGQGHTFSNFAINSSSCEYVGLFGYSKDATIKNVILDSSCSVVSSYSGSDVVFAGGIAGHYQAFNSLYAVENIVILVSVSFTGSTSWNLFLGGIVGRFWTSNKVIMKNCANYGSVTFSGNATGVGYSVTIGGIIGDSSGSSSTKYIQNCLNYGTITHNGTTTGSLYIGGILGHAIETNLIENCVSGGKITSNKKDECYIGSVVGYASSSTAITHCYWTSDVGNYNASGSGSPTTDNETSQVSLNTTTMNSLNSYASEKGVNWNKWFMLHLNGGSINNLNQTSLIVTQKHFPDPVKEGNAFLFWCLDTNCNEKYDPKATNIAKVTELYAVWNIVNVKFDGNGGTPSQQTKEVAYGQKYGELPNTTRTGHTFTGWFTEKEEGKGEKVTENDNVKKGFDHTLYAQWTINNYTLTFDYGNGTVINEILKYNETINYPDNLTREDYAFPMGGKLVQRECLQMIPQLLHSGQRLRLK